MVNYAVTAIFYSTSLKLLHVQHKHKHNLIPKLIRLGCKKHQKES